MQIGSPLRLAGERSWQSTAPTPSLPRFATGHPRRRFWLALKIGSAAVVASLFSIVDSLNQLTGGSAPWAVVTVVVVMEPTLGATLSKGTNRIIGTVSAAGAAALAGYGTKMLLPSPYDAGLLSILLFAATSTLNYLRTAPASKDWQYAYLIAYLTFDFLALRAFHEKPEASYNRVLMIGSGGLIALLVMLLPTGESTAAAQAKGMLADALSDCAEAVLVANQMYASGRSLHRLESIDRDLAADDDVHSKWSEVIKSRAGFEEAVKSASWEACKEEGEHAVLRELGRAVRRLAYTTFSLDTLLRDMPRRPPPSSQPTEEAALLQAMGEAAKAIHDRLRQCALLIIAAPPQRSNGGSEPLALSDSALLAPSTAAEAASSLDAVVAPLNEALDDYVRTSTCAHTSTAQEGDRTDMQGPANHIAFAKLMLVTITRVEAILLKTAQLAAQRRGRSSGAPPPLQPRENGGVQEDDGVVLV